MKRHITKTQFLELPPKAQALIFEWQKKHNYPYDYALSIGDCIELLTEITRNLHKEVDLLGEYNEMQGSYFDNILANSESVIAWQGKELIDILFYEISITLKKYLASIPFSDIV